MTTKNDAKAIVPAESGWRVCEPVGPGGDAVDDFIEQEVVAWVVNYSDEDDGFAVFATPVTADPEVDSSGRILRSPIGRYFIPGHCDFKDRQQAIQHEHAKAQKKR